jgi:D-alanyl-D-alanine carboxypeptidase/D-alanyl-D-alanine-endopeptidase (penicillin-binding protein 4)
MFRRTLLAALLFAGTIVHAADLPEPVARMMQAAKIPAAAAGIVVLRGDTVLLAHNPQQVMQPASTMKLFTAMTALEQLGPVFRGRTELRSSADVEQGVLRGDLIVRGGADADFNEDVLTHMLQALRNQGITAINGDVVLDRTLFQPARTDLGQPPFDEYPWAYYNVVPDALLINTNLLKLELRAVGGQLSIVTMPDMENVTVRSDLRLTDAACAQWEQGWRTPDFVRSGDRIDVVLHGSFPRDCVKTVNVNVLDTHDYLARLVRATWRKLGGTIAGTVREASAPALPVAALPAPPSLPAAATAVAAPLTTAPANADAEAGIPAAPPAATPVAPVTTRLLAEHVSRALPEVLRDINKNSDNTLARTLFLSLGSLEADPQLGSRPLPPDGVNATTSARAEAAIRSWLQQHQIDSTGLVLDNGSGLSRLERATPAQLAGVLQAGLKSNWMPEFLSSLPIAATDGTMRRRLKDSPAATRARIKTGSLNGVIAIAGYVQDANNQPLVVVALLNDPHVASGAGRAVLDALIDWVARQ